MLIAVAMFIISIAASAYSNSTIIEGNEYWLLTYYLFAIASTIPSAIIAFVLYLLKLRWTALSIQFLMRFLFCRSRYVLAWPI